jgi:hypothetical protein
MRKEEHVYLLRTSYPYRHRNDDFFDLDRWLYQSKHMETPVPPTDTPVPTDTPEPVVIAQVVQNGYHVCG